jgi:hypothetical protein
MSKDVDMPKTCRILEISKENSSQLFVREIPLEYATPDLPKDELLAQLANNFTNSDELIKNLAVYCSNNWDKAQGCAWDFDQGLACELLSEAYRYIHQEAMKVVVESLPPNI